MSYTLVHRKHWLRINSTEILLLHSCILVLISVHPFYILVPNCPYCGQQLTHIAMFSIVPLTTPRE